MKFISQWPLITFIGIAFILFGNTLVNDYCLDDKIVITENTFTKEGIAGLGSIFSTESFTGFFGTEKQLVSGGRYRPFSIASFAVEYQFFGLNAHVSHFINVVLYALTGYLIYLVLLEMWPARDREKWYSGLAFVASALFLFHPVHTEVVANIKGRDEIFALLFGLISFWQSLLYMKEPKFKSLLIAGLSFLVALFSKEHALVFVFIIPIALALIKRIKQKELVKIMVALIIPSVIFLAVRQVVLGSFIHGNSHELMNDSFLQATPSQHYATVFYALLKYIQLLVFPHPLTYDYYPYHVQLTDWDNIVPLLSVVAYVAIITAALVFYKKVPLYTFSVLLFILPLLPVSNIFFPIGTFMSERFLYIPSLGFCIVAAYLLLNGARANIVTKVFSLSLVVLMGIFFGLKTIDRNKVWKDDYTLFTEDIKVSVNSAKGNCAAGGIIYDRFKTCENNELKKEKILQAVQYFKKAVAIYPEYEDAWLLMGNAYVSFPDSLSKAISCYKHILTINPTNQKAIFNLGYIANLEKAPEQKVEILELTLKYNPKSYDMLYKLGNTWGKELNNIPKAKIYLEKALEVNPAGIEALKDLGVAYAMDKDYRKSASIFERVVKIDSLDENAWINLGLTYIYLKEDMKAKECFKKAKLLQQKKND